jgi:uncharacterized protein (TIGR02001 family)
MMPFLIASYPNMDLRITDFKGFFRLLVGLSGVFLVTAIANAEWNGEISVLSDYLYRGYTKNRSRPLAQGHLEYQHAMGWFGGIHVSQVSFDDQFYTDRADFEAKPYVGWSLPINDDWRTELSVMGYVFDGHVFGKQSNYAEFFGSLHYQDWLSAQVSVAPDAYQRHVSTLNYELNYRRDILDNLQFSTGLGYYQAGALLDEDYFYWNAGATWFLTSHLALDARYVDVHLDAHHDDFHHQEFYPRLLESKFLLSVTLGF